MQTTDLIDRLAVDLRPTPQRAAWKSLVVALSVGLVVALGAACVSFGLEEDFVSMLPTSSLWMKWAYALGVGAAAFSLCARLARPEAAPGALPFLLGVPFLVLGAIAQRLAGFSAGCLAGAAAAGLYAIHCNETAAAFVVSWYTAGILLPALAGVFIGPRVLHW